MKKKQLMKLLIIGFIFLLPYCSKKPVKQEKVIIKIPASPKKVLASVVKMEIPRIEKQSKHVKVHVWAMRPSLEYSKEEVQISKMPTGYNIKIWLIKNTKPAKKLSFFKIVSFKIPKDGGYDIEVSGKNQNFLDIVFIDAK